jgi:hypothetical protein
MSDSSEVLNSIFKDCDAKGGVGKTDAPIVVIYGEPGKKEFFPHSKYLEQVCEQYKLATDLFYVTPVIKDRKPTKPISVYADLLVNEMAVVKPKMAWILGQDPLVLLGTKDVARFYRHVFGMYFPFLVRNFYGLLVVGRKELTFMPDNIKLLFHNRMKEASEEIRTFLSSEEKMFEPPEERRGDLYMINLMTKHTGLVMDPALKADNQFFVMWSDKVSDHIFVCKNEKAKVELLKLGFGLVFLQEEVRSLNKEDADFVAASMKRLKARKLERRTP